jgi:hypothetical protein
MLDLDAIFNPEQIPPARRMKPVPAPEADIRVEDLDPDWRIQWEERAAIWEHDGRLPRERAEAVALADILELMRRAGAWRRNDACTEPK